MTVARAFARGGLAASEDSAVRPQVAGAVLIVEDEALVREVTAEALTSAGFAVIEAASGDEAVAILETTPVLAIVTDVMMPGELDGVALAVLARTMAPELPVLVVSACHGHARLKDLPPGVPFLGKPYSDVQLVCAVRGLLPLTRAAA